MTTPDDPPRKFAGFYAGFAAATAFLTLIPVSTQARGTRQLGDTAWAFPLGGAGIGAAAGRTFLLGHLVRLGDCPAALLAALAASGLAGGCHAAVPAESRD